MALATHTHIASYVGMQLKFESQMTRAIFILPSTTSKTFPPFWKGGGHMPPPPPYPLHSRHSHPTSQSRFLQSGSLMLRARDGLKGKEEKQSDDVALWHCYDLLRRHGPSLIAHSQPTVA